MKIAVICIRILLGALMVFSSLAYFLQLFPQPELSGALKTFNDGIEAAGYLMPLVKAVELLAGLALLVGRFVPLAILCLFPIAVNILGVHLFLAPEGMPIALFVMLSLLFLGYAKRAHFKSVFAAK